MNCTNHILILAIVGQRFSLGSYTTDTLDAELQSNMLNFYANSFPDARVLSRGARNISVQSANFLNSRAKFHKYLVLDGRRLIPSRSLTYAPSAIIQADFNNTRYLGQIFDIITHHQTGTNGPTILINVHWLIRLEAAETELWDAQ